MNRSDIVILNLVSFFATFFFLCFVYLFSPMFSLTITSTGVVLVFFAAIFYNHYVLKMHLLSFPQVYLAVTFLFTGSGLLLYLLGSDIAFHKFKWFDGMYLIKAAELVILTVLSFQFGVHLSLFSKPRSKKDISKDSVPLRFVAAVSALVAIGIFVFVYPSFFVQMFQVGYADFVLYQAQNDVRVPTTLLYFLFPLLAIIFACTWRNDNEKILAYFAAAVVCTLFLLVGSRFGCFSFLLTFLITMRTRGSRISNVQIVLLALMILFIIPIIFQMRNLSEVQMDGLFEKALQETGSSLQVLMGTMMIIPETEDYMYGEAYIYSIKEIIPNIGNWQSTEEKVLSRWIHAYMNPQGSGLGFLQIAEAYSQFGVIGVWIFFIIFGILLGNWYIRLEYQSVESYMYIWYGYGFYAILNWVRNHSGLSIRPIVWSYIFLLAVRIIVNSYWKHNTKSHD